MQKNYWLAHVLRIAGHRRIDASCKVEQNEELVPPQSNSNCAKDVIDDDVGVSNGKKQDAHLLYPPARNKPCTHSNEGLVLVLAGCVVQCEVQNEWPVALLFMQVAKR